jgi:hypothetical protein
MSNGDSSVITDVMAGTSSPIIIGCFLLSVLAHHIGEARFVYTAVVGAAVAMSNIGWLSGSKPRGCLYALYN